MGDRDEIKGLMLAYCRAIDSGDWEAFRALMGRALWLVEGQAPPPASANNVIVYEDGTPRTKHVITNIAILVDPEGDRAEGHSYVTVYQQIPADQLRTIFSGEYCDRFARAEGRWYFTERDIRRPLYGDLSKHLKDPQRTFPRAPLS